jgi:hypothetical protein
VDEIKTLEYLIIYGGLNPWKYLNEGESGFFFLEIFFIHSVT